MTYTHKQYTLKPAPLEAKPFLPIQFCKSGTGLCVCVLCAQVGVTGPVLRRGTAVILSSPSPFLWCSHGAVVEMVSVKSFLKMCTLVLNTFLAARPSYLLHAYVRSFHVVLQSHHSKIPYYKLYATV